MPRKAKIVANQPGRRGPKPKPVDLDRVHMLASRGLTTVQIAHGLGMVASTFHDKVNRNPEISKALNQGRAEGIRIIANALFEKARSGDTSAQIFFLKARAGWKDRLELSGDPENPVQHVISAKPLTVEEWEEKYGEKAKLIEGERLDEAPEN